MSFLTQYLKKHRLDKISDKQKERLEQLEEKLSDIVKNDEKSFTFEDLLKQHGEHIADLVERLSNYLKNLPPWSLANTFNLFRFVGGIAIEVYQMVESMSQSIIKDGMTDQQKHETKVTLGKELVYFVWEIVNPLGNYFNWLPFKKTIEKTLVFWLAEMALDNTVDLFEAKVFQISIMEAGTIVKAVPG